MIKSDAAIVTHSHPSAVILGSAAKVRGNRRGLRDCDCDW